MRLFHRILFVSAAFSQGVSDKSVRSISQRIKGAEREKLASAIDHLTKILSQYDASEALERKLQELAEKQSALCVTLEKLQQQKANLLEQKADLARQHMQEASEQSASKLAELEITLQLCFSAVVVIQN